MILELFELVARIFKIVLLSTVYGSLLLLIAYYFSKKTQNQWLKRTMSHKVKSWLVVHFSISICLFIYSFSYWQNVGLGENPSLPIGYGQRIYSPDFEWTYFYSDPNRTELNKDELPIENFIVRNDTLFAKISHNHSGSPNYDFIISDLSTGANRTLLNEAHYLQHAKVKGLPMRNQFVDLRPITPDIWINSRNGRNGYYPDQFSYFNYKIL